MDPVFQALLNPFRHRKDSSKIFSDREFVRSSLMSVDVRLFDLIPGHQSHPL